MLFREFSSWTGGIYTYIHINTHNQYTHICVSAHKHTYIFANCDFYGCDSAWSKKPSRQVSDFIGTLEVPLFEGQEEAGTGLPIMPCSAKPLSSKPLRDRGRRPPAAHLQPPQKGADTCKQDGEQRPVTSLLLQQQELNRVSSQLGLPYLASPTGTMHRKGATALREAMDWEEKWGLEYSPF